MAKLLTVLLAEASIESFPEDLMKDLKVRNYFSKLKKSPSEVMLDVNFHQQFIEDLPDLEKRGRPDIVHFTLLSCFGSILARQERLQVIIHTYDDKVITLNPEIRLPKSIERFNGLILQLFKDGRSPPSGDQVLMNLEHSTLPDLVKDLREKHDMIIEFSVKGEQLTSVEYSKIIFDSTNPLLIFGAFPHGEIRNLPSELVDKKLGIYEKGLDLFAVISQILASQHMIEEESLSKEEESDDQSITWR
jgi:rRNA small subunit pseudouridine methyltransferase Nep1